MLKTRPFILFTFFPWWERIANYVLFAGKPCAITNLDMFARLKIEVERKARAQVAPAQGGKLRRVRKRGKRKPRSKSAAPPPRKQRSKSGAKSDSEL